MKTISRILLISVAVAAVAVNLHCNKSGDSTSSAKSGAYSAKPEAYRSTSAYISVHETASEQAMLEAITESYALMATSDSMLRHSVEKDGDFDGKMRRDRIKHCKYFTGDKGGIIKNLQRDLQVRAIPGTNLIRVSMKSAKQPEQAEIVNAVADAIIAVAKERNVKLSQEQMHYLRDRLNELENERATCMKDINDMRGQNEVAFMIARSAIMQDSTATLLNTITSLRLQKVFAEGALEAFQEKQKSGDLAKSPEIRSQIAKNPGVVELRAAILRSRITLLADEDNRQLIVVQKKLEKMLDDRQQKAASEAISLKSSKLEGEVTSISERLLAIGNQYNELMQGLRDLETSLAKIKRVQARMARIEQQISEVNARILECRIRQDESPLSLWASAETH